MEYIQMMMDHILQNGCAKSGNYWLYMILTKIMDEAGIPNRNYIQNHPIQSIAAHWELSHPDQATLNVIDIEPGKIFCRIGSYFREPLDDIDEYIQETRLVWTHSPLNSDSLDVYRKFDRVVYIIRDPRDVAISMAHFMFTPYKQKTTLVSEENPMEYLRSNFIRHITGWVNHVASHLLAPRVENMYVVFYERLREDFVCELDKLTRFLEVKLSSQQKDTIEKAVSLDNMRRRANRHVRAGVAGGWRGVLTTGQARWARIIAGPLMTELGYPTSVSDASMPHLPENLDRRRVRAALRRAMTVRGLKFIMDNAKHLKLPISR